MKTYLLAWNPKRWIWDNIVEMSEDVKMGMVVHDRWSSGVSKRPQICEFDFFEVYGDIGRDFIHVHHLKQISEIGETYNVDPIKDLRPVCANCHAILHKRKLPYTIDEVKGFLRK